MKRLTNICLLEFQPLKLYYHPMLSAITPQVNIYLLLKRKKNGKDKILKIEIYRLCHSSFVILDMCLLILY
jgi:hypothetical protein